ncbi:MAG: flippase [Thiotrichales bacterium]
MKIVDNLNWLFFGNILRMVGGLLIGVWIARYLGPEQFGKLNYVVAFLAIFGPISTLGLQNIVVRDIVNHPDKASEILGSAFVLSLFGGVLSYIFAIFLVSVFHADDNLYRLMVSILGIGLILKSSEVISYWFESQVESKFVEIVANSVYVLNLGARVVLILLNAPLIAFVWMLLLDAALVASGLFAMFWYRYKGFSCWNFRKAQAKSMLKNSWPYIIMGMSVVLYARIDQLMIPMFLGDLELGLFSASVRITEAWLFVPVIVASSLLPSIIEAKKISNKKYEERLFHLYGLTCLISVPLALVVTLFSGMIMSILFGIEYYEARHVLQIRIWETVFAAMGVAVGKWILIENHQKITMIFTFIGMLINILANIIFIPAFGIEGAAIASVFSIVFSIIILPLARKDMRADVKRRLKALLLYPYVHYLINSKPFAN